MDWEKGENEREKRHPFTLSGSGRFVRASTKMT